MRWFLVLLISVEAFATNCTISILNEKYNGEKVRLTFHSRLNSKSECEALAKMHKPNAMTREVRRKSVTYSWGSDDSDISSRSRKRKNW